MKINKDRIFARRYIIVKDLTILLIISIVILEILKYFEKLTPLYFIVIFTAPFLLTVLFYHVRIRFKEDGRRMEKLQAERLKEYHKGKDRVLEAKKEVKTSFYMIRNIVPNPECAASFFVEFQTDFIKNVLPEITLLDTKLSIQRISDNTILCFTSGVLRASDEKLNFKSGKHEFSINNPYYHSSYGNQNTKWQCEGHKEERLIFINKECFPNAHVQALYRFDLLISNKVTGTFSGRYIPEENKIVVALWNTVHKKNCLQRECVIQLTEDKRVKIKLPSPEVFSSNYVPVAK